MMYSHGTVHIQRKENGKSRDGTQTAALTGNISCETTPEIVKVCR
jgi:hypothetical protein